MCKHSVYLPSTTEQEMGRNTIIHERREFISSSIWPDREKLKQKTTTKRKKKKKKKRTKQQQQQQQQRS